MLFNSYGFIFGFLPIALGGFFWLGHLGRRDLAIVFLGIASLVFYGWSDFRLVGLILVSIAFNYLVGSWISRTTGRFAVLWLGAAGDLGLLAYFKYGNFIADNVHAATGLSLLDYRIALPIGISFFTFTQIAFLVDVYRNQAREYRLWHYLLFVTYFPHLIAGPILHHKELIPQFSVKRIFRPQAAEIAIGLALFSMGLFKKVVIADGIAPDATAVFSAAAHGVQLGFIESWIGALAYALQIYFDFSGYSDMAIGLSRLFGIRLPVNFMSPYKAIDFIDFWRRWHMTLSRFLRDYLYISLGGNRKGRLRRYINLLATMVLGGLWHGASWNFVVWGALHGAFLAINHAWRDFAMARGWQLLRGPVSVVIARTVTFVLVVVAWVPFRAETLAASVSIWRGMIGYNGLDLPDSVLTPARSANFPDWLLRHITVIPIDNFVPHFAARSFSICVLLYLFCRLAPNTIELAVERHALHKILALPVVPRLVAGRMMPLLAVVLGLMLGYCLSVLWGPSEFLYFRF